MPGGDKTGPNGDGPKTGRQMGNCEGAISIEWGSRQYGRGLGRRGCNRGRGFRCGGYIPLTKEEEIKLLESEKKEIDKRLSELK